MKQEHASPMNIVFFSNPAFFADKKVQGFTSMPRYVNMLATAMKARGHSVEILAPKPVFFNLPGRGFKKWLGYVDQYIIFPRRVKASLRKSDPDTIYVYTDQAQGPWVPLGAEGSHVIHCHDFLSQQSLDGSVEQNQLSFTGKLYQQFIRKGLVQGKHFISVSLKTKSDLANIGIKKILTSEVVYNGVSDTYYPSDISEARKNIGVKLGLDLSKGYILNVGSNLWYKNRLGTIEIYDCWNAQAKDALPLIMIGEEFTPEINRLLTEKKELKVYRLANLSDNDMQQVYAGATVLLFPSFAEGFGWPIAEALSCGCPVITTNVAPMTEVGGSFGSYISKKTSASARDPAWEAEGVDALNRIANLSAEEREKLVLNGIAHAKNFNKESAMDKVESIYLNILAARLPAS